MVIDLKNRQHGCIGDDNDGPSDGEGDWRVPDVAYGHGGDRMNDSQVAVQWHQYQRVDAGVSCHVHSVLVYLRPSNANYAIIIIMYFIAATNKQ